ncbi:hypothetical protein FRB90_004034 [Tulasnella sp. 427]|nr:hypothetical protein FRB90_004034 [Tulasnella sp. 427]
MDILAPAPPVDTGRSDRRKLLQLIDQTIIVVPNGDDQHLVEERLLDALDSRPVAILHDRTRRSFWVRVEDEKRKDILKSQLTARGTGLFTCRDVGGDPSDPTEIERLENELRIRSTSSSSSKFEQAQPIASSVGSKLEPVSSHQNPVVENDFADLPGVACNPVASAFSGTSNKESHQPVRKKARVESKLGLPLGLSNLELAPIPTTAPDARLPSNLFLRDLPFETVTMVFRTVPLRNRRQEKPIPICFTTSTGPDAIRVTS